MTFPKKTALTALFAAALAAGPGRAQEPKLADVKADLDALKKQVEDIKAMQKQIGEVILGRNEWKTPEDAGLQKRLDAMAEAIRKLDEKLTKVGDQVNTTTRTAGSSPINSPVPAKGTVRLVNDYFYDVSIVLNGVSHLLAPRQTKDVAVAPGDFAYALPQSGGVEKKSPIRDGETVTLRIK